MSDDALHSFLRGVTIDTSSAEGGIGSVSVCNGRGGSILSDPGIMPTDPPRPRIPKSRRSMPVQHESCKALAELGPERMRRATTDTRKERRALDDSVAWPRTPRKAVMRDRGREGERNSNGNQCRLLQASAGGGP